MIQDEITGALHADERAHAARLLASYPDLSESEVAELRNWFQRVATPADREQFGQDAMLGRRYRTFYKDQLSPFSLNTVFAAVLGIGIAACLFGIGAMVLA